MMTTLVLTKGVAGQKRGLIVSAAVEQEIKEKQADVNVSKTGKGTPYPIWIHVFFSFLPFSFPSTVKGRESILPLY